MLQFLAGHSVERDDVWPFARRSDESARNGVLHDVIPFFRIMGGIANSRIKKVLLKINLMRV